MPAGGQVAVVSSDLVRTVQRLSLCRDREAVVAVLRSQVRALTGADGMTVVLRDGPMCHYVEEDAIGPLWKGRRFPLETCISGWCMLQREPVAIPDIYLDPRIPHDAYRPTFVRSLAMVPIRSEDPVGALGAYWAETHDAGEDTREVLQMLADSASIAFANVLLIEALQEEVRRRDQYLAMLAHELRNPLAPIRTGIELLRLADPTNAGLRTRAVMERQVRHLTRILDDLLDASRITRGHIAVETVPVDLTQCVREGVEDQSRVLEQAGLQVTVETPPGSVWAIGDPTRLSQLLGNLLDNAARFTPRGGRVEVRLWQVGGRARITVRDTGSGIAPALLPKLFEPFVQGAPPAGRHGGGLGLGLVVARHIAELHGGSIVAASDGPGQGATFAVELSLGTDTSESEPDPTPCEGGQGRRVLVIEDNADAADTLQLLLELFGHRVTVARTGPDGLARALNEPPDIIVCDIGLPGMDGYEIARQLRSDPRTATVRLIALTGYGQEHDRRRALDAGFDVHLTKPVEPNELCAQVALQWTESR